MSNVVNWGQCTEIKKNNINSYQIVDVFEEREQPELEPREKVENQQREYRILMREVVGSIRVLCVAMHMAFKLGIL